MQPVKQIPKPVLLLYSAAIMAVCFAIYFKTLYGGLFLDDSALIHSNKWITSIRYIPDIFLNNTWYFFGGTRAEFFRPMVHVFLTACYHFFGVNPWWYHFVNISVHAGVSVLVLIIAGRLAGEKTFNYPAYLHPAFLAALLFAAHPVHTEAVAWIAAIQETSYAFFLLLAFYLYMKSYDEKTSQRVWLALSTAAFFFAAFSKEPGLLLPAMLAVYDWRFRNEKVFSVKYLKRYIPYFSIILTYLILRFHSQTHIPVHRRGYLSSYMLFINAFPLFVNYLRKLLLPFNLNYWHQFHPIWTLLTPGGLAYLVCTAAFLILALVAAKKDKTAAIALTFLIVPLLPALYARILSENVFCERYLYLPSFGFVLLLIPMFERMSIRRPKWTAALSAAVLAVSLFYCVGTVRRSGVWGGANYAIWRDTINRTPEQALIPYLLGHQMADAGRIDEAIEQFKKSISINPNIGDVYRCLGVALYQKGLIDESIAQIETALRIEPDNVAAYVDLGVDYEKKGDYEKAVAEYQKALSIDPEYELAKKYLADDLEKIKAGTKR